MLHTSDGLLYSCQCSRRAARTGCQTHLWLQELKENRLTFSVFHGGPIVCVQRDHHQESSCFPPAKWFLSESGNAEVLAVNERPPGSTCMLQVLA